MSAVVKLSAAHAFNGIVLKVKFALTSYEELPPALACVYVHVHLFMHVLVCFFILACMRTCVRVCIIMCVCPYMQRWGSLLFKSN